MASIQELKEKLSELVADPWADKAEVEAAQKALEEAQALEQPERPEYEAVADLAKSLGIDPVQTARYYSEIEIEDSEAARGKLGMYALRLKVENVYMRRRIKEMELHASGSVFTLAQLDKPATPPLKSKK